MNLKRYLNSGVIKNFSILTISNILVQFCNIIVSIRIARVFTTENFGKYNLLQLYISIFATVAGFGFRNIIIRTLARDRNKTNIIFIISMIFRFLGVLFSIILFSTYVYYKNEFSIFFVFLTCQGILFFSFFDLFESIAFGHENMYYSGVINFISSLLWLIVILVLPKNLLNLNFVFGLFVLIYFFKTLFYLFTLIQKRILNYSIKKYSLRFQSLQLFKQSSYFYFLAILTLLSNQIPILFLATRSEISQVAYFNIANRLLSPFNLILTNSMTALFPNLAKLFINDKGKFIKKIKLAILIMTIFGIFGAFGISFFRREVVVLLYGNKYTSAGLVMAYQTWYVSFYSIICFLGIVLGSIDRQKDLSIISFASAIIQVPILWLFAKGGAKGLSVAFLLANLIIYFVHIFHFFRILPEIKPLFYFKILGYFVITFFLSISIPENLFIGYKFILIFVLGIPTFYYIKYLLKNKLIII